MRNRGAGCSCPSRTCSARCGSCFPATRSSQGARFRRHSGRRVQSSGPRRSEGGWRSEGTSPGRRATRLDTRRCFWPEVGRPPKSVYPFSRPGDRMPPFQGLRVDGHWRPAGRANQSVRTENAGTRHRRTGPPGTDPGTVTSRTATAAGHRLFQPRCAPGSASRALTAAWRFGA